MDHGTVSLRFRHPARELGFLSEALGLTPFRTWTVGTPRQTPHGEMLEGVHRDSYWVVRLPFEPGVGFGSELNRAIDLLRRAEAVVRDHVASGGTVEVHINLTGWINNGDSIPAPLLATMAELGLTLVIEVFPD